MDDNSVPAGQTPSAAYDQFAANDRVAGFLVDCSSAAKVQYAIACAVGFGWLTPEQHWEIEVTGGGTVVAAGVLDTLRLMTAFDTLYGGSSAPARCTVEGESGFAVTWKRNDTGEWSAADPPEVPGERLRIAVESRTSPFQGFLADDRPDLAIRPAFLPAELAIDPPSGFDRQAISLSTFDEASSALEAFLRAIYRKFKFRPMQGEAIFNSLRQKDCVVLLPTGAGKSIIYQLAGLLMPGVTLVVDPLISLIEDQVEGLQTYGIDRVVGVAGGNSTRAERDRLLRRMERGEYHYILISPERLQIPQFRSTLQALAELTSINLAVIDEAHCVSEWGHDFRPAYLHLAPNLRQHCKGNQDQPPPILALTGTASRAVLRDMLVDLDIDRERSDALIRPPTFDRPELMFKIVRTSPEEDPAAKLRGVLNALPGMFRFPRTEFYRPSGKETRSGLVFVPFVNGLKYGLLSTQDDVSSVTAAETTIYSGKAPRGIDEHDWKQEKSENARAFKANKVPILVATKAFGMGIDKPNIRYTVHFGMPSSLESFYQEAGRAGRDKKPARCIVVFSEYDRDRSDELLDVDLDLKDLHKLYSATKGNYKSRDDINRAFFFHLQNFGGADAEIENLKQVISELGNLTARKTVELPFTRRSTQEKALYRLLRVEAIEDYEVDFGKQQFTVHVPRFDLDRCKKALMRYIKAAQPAKSLLLARQLDEIQTSDPNETVLELVSILIRFTYDVIERSRRRMIHEAILLARQSKSDREIRLRLLNYLQEGLGAEAIEQLLDREEIGLSEWHNLIEKLQTPMDAGELRGLSIRALESYPNHPGLLLVRAVAESMCSDHDSSVSYRGLVAAIRMSVDRYELAQDDVSATIDYLFTFSRARADGLGLPLVAALLDLGDPGSNLSFAFKIGLRRGAEFDQPVMRGAIAAQRTRVMVRQLEAVVDGHLRQYEALKATQALNGT